ncbi:MAG: preprotein translocase subunit SecG [Desulfuromonadaceae bacterium GWC2_58_13]|nr:MAG: preprotein translocase subunit SecG [Desulfuromonadaceae bacterium GWC2_58_13]
MTTFLIILHIFVCLALIAIVLLQGGKGAEMGASFGAGGSHTVFGAAGGQSFMGKLTAAAAIIFMLTSLILAYFYGQPGSSSIMPTSIATEAPAANPAPEAAPQPTVPEAEKK